jgi:LPS export ABC transporter protein LptC
MFSVKNKNPKKLTFFLISVIFITFAVILTVFLGSRRILNEPEKIISSLEDRANISIDNVHQIATRDGKKEWSLEAASAQFMEENKQAVFKDLSVIFFLENGGEIYLTANRGILKTDSNDMEVAGNVVMKNESYRLKTDNLYYTHAKRLIVSKVPVSIFGGSFNVSADTMSFDLNTRKASFSGKVEGNFSGDLAI